MGDILSATQFASLLDLNISSKPSNYEFLHLIGRLYNQSIQTTADTINNLVIGTCEANSYMLQYENNIKSLFKKKKKKISKEKLKVISKNVFL